VSSSESPESSPPDRAMVPVAAPSAAAAATAVSGELVEPRQAWLPEDARALFTPASRLLASDPYLLHAPANTQRARRSDWALFCAFCEGQGQTALPATPPTVVAFLEAVQASPPLPGGRPRKEAIRPESLVRRERRARRRAIAAFPGRPRTALRSAKTLERYVTSIATAHRLAGLPDPSVDARVRNAVRALMGRLRAAQPRAPLRRAQLLEVMAGLWPAQPVPSGAGFSVQIAANAAHPSRRGWRAASRPAARLWDLRARAVLAALYTTMTRRSELVRLRVEDLPHTPTDGVVPIAISKTHRHEHRYIDELALRSIAAWCEAAGIISGPIFRELDPRGIVGERAMSPQRMVQIVRACWAHRAAQQAAGRAPSDGPALPLTQIPHLGAHSVRIGGAHDQVAAGQDILAVMHSGGWSDPRTVRKYIQELLAEDSGMARMLRNPAARRASRKASQPSAPRARPRARRKGSRTRPPLRQRRPTGQRPGGRSKASANRHPLRARQPHRSSPV
jgi:hypothetical protein